MFYETPAMVALRGGTAEKELLVASVTSKLKSLFDTNAAIVSAAVAKARNSDYKCSEGAAKVLRNFDLLNDNGSMDAAIRNIILSATEGKGERLILVNPVLTPKL